MIINILGKKRDIRLQFGHPEQIKFVSNVNEWNKNKEELENTTNLIKRKNLQEDINTLEREIKFYMDRLPTGDIL